MSDYDEINRCNRCGFCQSVCPTYLATRDEVQVARGRIYLTRMLIEGRYDFTKDEDVSEKVNDCLLCKACVVNCPATVRTDDIMLAARRDFLEATGLSLFHRLVYRGVLSHRERLDRTSFLMRMYERSGARNLLYGKTLRKALDKLAYYDSFLPADLQRPARPRLSEIVRPAGTPNLRVVYFLGCASNVFTSEIVLSSVALLSKLGVEVVIPKVGCCGEPHRSAGDETEARRLAKKNATLIFGPQADFVVTDCSTCASALRHYDRLLGDSPEGELARPKLSKVIDLTTLAYEHLGLSKMDLKPVGLTTITYHDPCHGIRGLGVKAAPREIIKAIPDLELKEMDGADSCCGGAGSYGCTHPHMSGLIASGKVENIIRSNAKAVATSCPACTLQLGAGLRRAGVRTPVAHPFALLAKASGAVPN
ncbi:MAG: (Fe-S)-binding protein [Deltaproteobacteria bacterium]|jgi:glycolate oxidase iron-sulfur subunit|nr:(Fe-S)-binding protein [Deltaproteobacteria bacterium]